MIEYFKTYGNKDSLWFEQIARTLKSLILEGTLYPF
jgi:hypothetical protein